MANKGSGIRFNLDNVTNFEVELNRGFDIETLSAEERERIDALNDEFKSKNAIPVIMGYAMTPCQCRQPEMMRRAIQSTRIKTPGSDTARIVLTQEDIDMWDFSVVITRRSGVMERLAHVTQHCRACNRLTLYGDSPAPTAHQIAVSILSEGR